MPVDRNIFLVSVPYAGSTVVGRMVHLMGGQHHGDRKSDPAGWRRCEMSWFNTLAHDALLHAQKRDPVIPIDKLQTIVTGGLANMRQPWIVKSIHSSISLNHLMPAIEASGTDPLFVRLDRDLTAIEHSYRHRVQFIDADRKIPGGWGMPVKQILAEFEFTWSLINGSGRKIRLQYEEISAAVRKNNRNEIKRLFEFLRPDEPGITKAMNVFDPDRAGPHKLRDGVKHKKRPRLPEESRADRQPRLIQVFLSGSETASARVGGLLATDL